MAAAVLLAAIVATAPSAQPAASAARGTVRGAAVGTALESRQIASEAGRWEWPLEPPRHIVQDFRAPRTQYSAGHRGVDLASSPGSVVRAVDDGVVSFAGVVVDRGVIAIDHGGGLVSSVEPVSPTVSIGDPVSRGQPIGVVATGGHCSAVCLHLGARRDGRYLSPLAFLRGISRSVLLPLG